MRGRQSDFSNQLTDKKLMGKQLFSFFARSIKKMSPIDEFASWEWRLIIIIGTASYAGWWFIYSYLGVIKSDALSVRLAIMSSAFIMVALSFRYRWVKKHLSGVFVSWSWIITNYHFYLVIKNDLNLYYISGLFILVALVGHFHSSLRAFIFYCVLIVVATTALTFHFGHRLETEFKNNYFFLVSGLLTSLSIFFFSVTAQRRLRAQLEMHRDQIFKESKWAAMGKLAGTIAHEVNTPLAVISLSLEQLRDLLAQNNQLGEMTDKVLVRAEATTVRVANIIKSLKMFSRSNKGDTFSTVTLAKLMEDAEVFLRQAVKSTDIKFRIVQNVEGPYLIVCRESELLQVLVNLINNARNAIKECTEKWISLSVDHIDQGLQFTVEDTGAGIDSKLEEKMFDGLMTSKDVSEGTGIGLNISQRIAHSHGGKITYARHNGRTQFMFWIPKDSEELRLGMKNAS